jgi:predicted RNA-binding protein associated with RNAse of E/G family
MSSAPSSVDVLLATLNATELGSLDKVAEKMQQVREQLATRGQAELAAAAASAIEALRRGDVAEWKRGRAFLQSKIGHLR